MTVPKREQIFKSKFIDISHKFRKGLRLQFVTFSKTAELIKANKLVANVFCCPTLSYNRLNINSGQNSAKFLKNFESGSRYISR